MEKTDYLPEVVEFSVTEQNEMPHTMGVFESIEDVNKFLAKNNITGINQAMRVSRRMDNFEKTEMRKRYSNILENILPEQENILFEKKSELAKAKEAEKQAQENFNAYENQAQTLAKEVKRGLVDIELSDLNTFRIPMKGSYYFYTFVNKEFKLCAIRDIPAHEAGEIFNASQTNESIFVNGEIETQKGAEK